MRQGNSILAASRRALLIGAAAVAAQPVIGKSPMREIEIVEAPSNLGLRPLREGHIPGTWRAPEALEQAGLHDMIGPRAVHSLPRPRYELDEQPGTRIRNGNSVRRYSEGLARVVSRVLASGNVPIVIGGDCSVLLGCLLGARTGGRCGLLHVDGHSDFFHPGNYDTTQRLGTVAGMDLALATGRGEALLTRWDETGAPLVADADAMQIGERDELDPDYAYRDIEETAIRRLTVRRVKEVGIAEAAAQAAMFVQDRGLSRLWLHVDVDVLDERVMPAVDSPGRPGLDFAELQDLLRRLCAQTPVIGVDVTVFDPDLDPDGVYAARLAPCLAGGFSPLGGKPESR